MATRIATIHDRCTRDGCGRVLHSVREAEAGVCSSCWMKEMPADTKSAMKRLIASAFNGSGDADRSKAVDDAMDKLRRDRGEK